MKKLGFLLIIFTLTIIFSACPPLLEDYVGGGSYGEVVTIGDDKLDCYKWFEILDKIAKDGKFVSLDLSKCTIDDKNELGGLIYVNISGEKYIAFDPFPASSSGKDFITSIILPTITQIIKNAVDDTDINDIFITVEKNITDAKKHSAFRSFSNLKSVKAENVTVIGNFAFTDCTALTEVVFPRVGHAFSDAELQNITPDFFDIGKYSFMGCTALKEVKFNSAAVIGEYAFKDCTNLSKLDFPEVWMIEKNAFEGCKSLVNVFFEKAAKINKEAFKDCTGLIKAEFNVMQKQDPANTPLTLPVDPVDHDDYLPIYDSVIFYPSAFTGCKALEVLNVRNAWNVYFAKDTLANIGPALDLYLLDELISASPQTNFGHPQNAEFFGKDAGITLKRVTIYVPVLTPPEDTNIYGNKIANNIMSFIKATYPKLAEININRK
jgi:hypothetical protein